MDQAVATATRTIPGFEVSFVMFSPDAYTPMEVGGRGWYPLMYQTAELNPYTGELVGSRLLADRTPLEFVTESMRPLHTGDFGGIWVKMIWFVRPAAEHDGAQRPAHLEQAHGDRHRQGDETPTPPDTRHPALEATE